MTFKPLFWPTVFTIPALIILLGLGTWQVQRLHMKTELLAQIEAKFDMSAGDLPAPDTWQNLKRETWNYTPVRAKGVFDHAHEFHVFTHLSDSKGRFTQAGYFVLTPFKLAGTDRSILVSRGFVPQNLKNADLRRAGQTEGLVALEGILRFSERPNSFTPEPDLKKNIWYGRDSAKMAGQLIEKKLPPLFIDLKTSEPKTSIPQAQAKKPIIKNNHLSYAITWYGIALGLIGVYILFHRKPNTRHKQKKK